MPRELTAQDREDLTPGEIAAIMGEPTEEAAAAALAEETAASVAAERAAEAANDKSDDAPELDDDGNPVAKPEPTAEEAAAAAAADAAEKAKASETSAEDLAALLEDENKPAPVVPKPVTYKGISEDAYKAETAKLNAEKAAAMKDLMDGTIDAEQYATIEAKVADLRDDLVANRTLARANQEASEQETARKIVDFQASIAALMKASKGQQVDYNADAKAQKQFDDASRLIAEDPDNAGLSPQQVCDKAHATVLALRGIVAGAAAAPTPPVAAKPSARATTALPVTLGGLPSAAPNAVASDLRAQFNQLEGEEAEDFLERLPKAQRQALLAGGAV